MYQILKGFELKIKGLMDVTYQISLFIFLQPRSRQVSLRFLWVGALVLGKKTLSVSTALTNYLIGVLVLVVYVVLPKFTFEEGSIGRHFYSSGKTLLSFEKVL